MASTRDAPRRSASKLKYPSRAPTSRTVLPVKSAGIARAIYCSGFWAEARSDDVTKANGVIPEAGLLSHKAIVYQILFPIARSYSHGLKQSFRSSNVVADPTTN